MSKHTHADERTEPQDLSFLDGLTEGRDYATIPLTQGQRAIVDVEDWWELNEYTWYAHFDPDTRSFYAVRSVPREGGGQITERMHRVIMEAPKGMCIDHIDGNTLDNRKDNLRLATNTQNLRNRRSARGSTSAYLGVSWRTARHKWEAQIQIDGKKMHLGLYDVEIDAALAYDAAARERHGAFANPNFPLTELERAV